MKLLNKLKLMFLTAILSFSTVATAGDLPFGSGGVTGNYYAMLNDVFSDEWCGAAANVEGKKEATFLNVESKGSIDNIDGIINKRFFGGIVQVDALKYYAKTMPDRVNENSLGVVAGLHIESFHLLIPKNWQPETEKSRWSFFGSDEAPVEISLDLLVNQRVGSWGGSLVSLKAVNHFYGLNADIVEVPESERKSPSYPILLVGGQPYKAVQDILNTGNYHLVAINYKELAIREGADFYSEVILNYNVGGKLIQTKSVGVQALLVAKKSRRASGNIVPSQLAACIEESLYDLADSFDTNPNWGSAADLFDKGQMIDWEYFEIQE